MVINLRKVFLDTPIFIYLFGDDERYKSRVDNFLRQCRDENALLATSVVVYKEFSAKPLEVGDCKLIKKFEDMLIDFNIKLIGVDPQVEKTSAGFRARYKWLKEMDSLLIASAACCGYGQFMTNDKKLKEILELEVLIIEEWFNRT